ncbi:hypothetical protein DFQ27_006069 [Actinomortierella ambigua]|uniref:Uncharacterized protein n=1 Tax=Actinomortierella ambigua TaxID=1343610 RepID=A0A9P6PZM5_9FUNG|nr:hypothetical protein DFQ27_006069 [Actinomortierella ambigua]
MASLAVIMTILALKPEAYSSLCETENLLQFLLNGLDLEQDPFAMISKNRQDATSINTLKEAVQEAGIVRRGQRVGEEGSNETFSCNNASDSSGDQLSHGFAFSDI